MDGSNSKCGRGVSQEAQPSTKSRDVEALGEAESKRVTVSRRKGSVNPKHMRPADLCYLLNSTPLGCVTNHRQLYRHRRRAGLLSDDRRVNFFEYLAWLVYSRHVENEERISSERERCESITTKAVLALLMRQQYRCALTGDELTPNNSSLDHIMPISRGGRHHVDNAQALLRDVNRAKGTMTNEEFVALCRKVVACVDCRSA